MRGMDAKTGKACSGVAHLSQSIRDILTTPIGSRIERREYGSLLPELIDAPGNGAHVLQLYAATATALIRWEPRLRLRRVAISTTTTTGRVDVDIEGSMVTGDSVALAVSLREN